MDSTCCQVSQPYWKTTQIQQSETEGKNEVSDPVEHKVSITQDILIESRKNGEGLTCPGLSSTKPGWAQVHITAQVGFPPWGEQKKTIVTCGDLASRRGDDRGGGGGRGGP